MQSHCPHCDSLVDVPDRQTDVLCPNCQRFFLWTPSLDAPFESSKDDNKEDSEKSSDFILPEQFPEQDQPDDPMTMPELPTESEHSSHAHSVGLYKDYTLGGQSEAPAPKRKMQSKKTGKNMYPYELPGQVVEADRRMPVYSSMMYDAFLILRAHVGTMLSAVIVFGFLMGGLTIGAGAAYFALAQLTASVNVRMALFAAILLVASVGYVWIINGQKLYIISLIRQGKTSTSLLFSGAIGLFRNLVVFWIHLIPLTIPAAVLYGFYIWSNSNGGDQTILENDLGWFYYVFQQTPAAVAVAAAVIGFGAFLIIILNWGLAFWLIIDKDLGISESLDVSHKITYEKKATFLGVLTSSAGVVTALSCVTLGIAMILVPISLLFIGMYYMKTAIQEMVIPGKTTLGAHASLYGDNGELSDQYDEEEDIL